MSSEEQRNLKKKLNYEDVFCIACRCIFLRPVTMPCNHTLCLECFKNMVNITAYECPTCRKRISNWLRKYKDNWDSLVNEKLWAAVQQQYPREVQKRLNDEDDGLEENIVGQGIIRIETNKGELKNEYDNMVMNFQQEQAKIELNNLELAKRLQEEEETQKMLHEKMIQEDFKLASTLQETAYTDFQHKQSLLDKDNELAKQLQGKIESEIGHTKNTKQNKSQSSRKKPIKEGPLDKFFSKLSGVQISQVQYDNMGNCLPSCSLSPNTSSSLSSPRLSSSCNPGKSSTSIHSCEILKENVILGDCTCGRLLECSNKPLCQFCINQMVLFDNYTQQKNDYAMAQDLENAENSNIKKRSNPIQSSEPKKVMKVSKGQQTLTQVLQKSFNENVSE